MKPKALNAALDEGRNAALEQEAKLAERYRAALAQIGRFAARRFTEVTNASLTAAAPTPASAMVAVYPTPEQADALAQPNGEPAEIIHVTLAFLGEVAADQAEAIATVVRDVAATFEYDRLEGTVGGIAAFGSETGFLAELARIAGLVKPDGGYGETLWNRESATVLWIPADWTTEQEQEAAAQAFLTVPTVKAVEVAEAESAPPAGDEWEMLWANGQALVEASYPSILLPDVPGLAELRHAVCEALSEAGIPYAENHGWTPHATLDYTSEPSPPPETLLGLPLTFENLSFTQADVARDFPLGQEAALLAAGPPDWNPPHGDEIVDTEEIIGRLRTKADPVRKKAVEAVATPALDEARISWDVTNPFVDAVLEKTGAEIVGIAETTRLNVLRLVREGYEQGLSIPDTAKAIREGMAEAAPARATMIARTEMAALQNGAAVAATQIVAQETGIAYFQRWLTAPGAENPRHEDYEGLDQQTVPLGALFDVGGAKLEYPGDPAGPPEETIQCRCTVIFLEQADLAQEGDIVAELADTTDELAAIELDPIVGDDIATLASSVVARAKASEPKLTEIMKKVVEPRGGVLEGLPFRLKSEASMERKIQLVADQAHIPVKASANAMKDSVRYTAVYGPADFAAKTTSTLNALKAAGVIPERISSVWKAGSPYVGTNVVMKAPNGIRFELQFHTPESLATKQALNHGLYEQWRKLDPALPEAKALEQRMVANADRVLRPKGITTWKYDPSVEAEVGVTPFRTGDDPIGFYDSDKFKRFEADVQNAAKQYGVEVERQAKVAGVWEGEEEPAVALRIHDGELGVRAFAAELGKAYDQDGVLLFTAKQGEDVVATFGSATVPRAESLERIGALPRLLDPSEATQAEWLAAAEKKGLPGDIAARVHESQMVPKSLLLNDRYDVSVAKLEAKGHQYQPEYSIRYAPHQTPGIKSFVDKGRDALHTYYDPEVGQVGPHPIFEGRQTVTPKPASGYLTWEQMKESYPNWDTASSDFVYRGMSAEEMAEVVRTGEIKSYGAYNIGKEQEGLTFFGTDASIANSYASSYAPVSMKATFDRPAFIVKVRRPADEQLVLNPRLENEVGVRGSVPADQIVEVIEVRPYEVQEGVMELKASDPYDPASPYAQAGSSGGSGEYVYRSLGPLGGAVDRQQIFAAMADVGLPAGRFLEDGRLQVIGSGPEFVAQLDRLAARLNAGYDADVGEFLLLEKTNGDYEAAIRNFGGAQGQQIREAKRGAKAGDRGPAAVGPGAPGREAGAPQVSAAPDALAAKTLPQPAVPVVPEPLTPAQVKRLSVDDLWSQYGDLGKIENAARAEVADASQAPFVDSLWKRGEGRLPKGAVRYTDLAGDQQIHSLYSDGHQRIDQMAEEARARGQRQIVVSDHSHLLTEADIRLQHAEIDLLNEGYQKRNVDFRILKGIEVNILPDGTLDTATDILSQFDVVNASINAPAQGEQLALFAKSNTERLIQAMENPQVKVIVHPHSVDADWDKVAKVAAKKNIALEVNGRDLLRNDRQDAAAAMIVAAKKHGAKLAFGSDAHTSGDLADIVYAIRFAGKNGVTAEDIVLSQRLHFDPASTLPGDGEITLGRIGSKRLGGGLNIVWKVEKGDQALVVKPEPDLQRQADMFGMESSDRIRENITPGSDLEREQASYVMSRYFNEEGAGQFKVNVPAYRISEIVQPAALGRAKVRAGVSEFIEGETAGESGESLQNFIELSSDPKVATEETRSAALFDAVIGNTDRHVGNWIYGDDGHLWLIDHGLAFPESAIDQFQNEQIIDFAAYRFKQNLLTRERDFLERLLARWPEIKSDLLGTGLDPVAVTEMKTRIQWMLDENTRRPWPHGSDLW